MSSLVANVWRSEGRARSGLGGPLVMAAIVDAHGNIVGEAPAPLHAVPQETLASAARAAEAAQRREEVEREERRRRREARAAQRAEWRRVLAVPARGEQQRRQRNETVAAQVDYDLPPPDADDEDEVARSAPPPGTDDDNARDIHQELARLGRLRRCEAAAALRRQWRSQMSSAEHVVHGGPADRSFQPPPRPNDTNVSTTTSVVPSATPTNNAATAALAAPPPRRAAASTTSAVRQRIPPPPPPRLPSRTYVHERVAPRTFRRPEEVFTVAGGEHGTNNSATDCDELEAVTCPICLDVLEDAVQLLSKSQPESCGHVCCHRCFQQLARAQEEATPPRRFEQDGVRCPLCRTVNAVAHPHPVLRRRVKALKCMCACGAWTGTVAEYYASHQCEVKSDVSSL